MIFAATQALVDSRTGDARVSLQLGEQSSHVYNAVNRPQQARRRFFPPLFPKARPLLRQRLATPFPAYQSRNQHIPIYPRGALSLCSTSRGPRNMVDQEAVDKWREGRRARQVIFMPFCDPRKQNPKTSCSGRYYCRSPSPVKFKF